MTKLKNMPSLIFNISEAEIEKLSYERYSYPDPMVQKRIYAVWLKGYYWMEQFNHWLNSRPPL